MIFFLVLLCACVQFIVCEKGCDGIEGSGLVVDACGVCGGSNACQCDASDLSKRLDSCSYCGNEGDALWNLCVGCDGNANSGLVYDACGVCSGNNECIGDCDGKPFSSVVRDVCGVCGGDGSTCAGCDGVAGSGKVVDLCGECGGANECSICNQRGKQCEECVVRDNLFSFCECARRHAICATQSEFKECPVEQQKYAALCDDNLPLTATYRTNCPQYCPAAATSTLLEKSTAESKPSTTTTSKANSKVKQTISLIILLICLIL